MLIKLDKNCFESVMCNARLGFGKHAQDVSTEGFLPVLVVNREVLTTLNNTCCILQTVDTTEMYSVEAVDKQAFDARSSASKCGAALTLKSELWSVSANSSVLHEQKSKTDSKDTKQEYVMVAQDDCRCCKYNLTAALTGEVIQPNTTFIADVERLLALQVVSAADIRKLREKYGDQIATEAVIGMSATADRKMAFSSQNEAAERARQLNGEIRGDAQLAGGGSQKGTYSTSEAQAEGKQDNNSTWNWQSRGGGSIAKNDPRSVAMHRSSPEAWRVVEYTKIDSIFSVLSTEMQDRCIERLGHLMPMKRVHGDIEYTGLHCWDEHAHCALRHGAGVAVWVSGPHAWARYEGDWRNGTQHGQSVFVHANGDRYVGEWVDGSMNGNGVMTYASGDVYDGEWQMDYWHGRGVLTCADGSSYDGNWQHGEGHGLGVLITANSGTYGGEFIASKLHGKGIFTDTDGSSYIGDWVEGKKHGRGLYKFAGGESYDGEWKDNMRHGTGLLLGRDGCSYRGDWQEHCFHGTGTCKYANGDSYSGQWQYGHGYGVYTYANGTTYEGDFKENGNT